MKTIDSVSEKKSIFSKLIEAFTNTAFYKILISGNDGISMDADKEESRIDVLARSTDLSTEELRAIDDAFKKASVKINDDFMVQTTPTTETVNPFKVDEKDLSPQGQVTQAPRAKGKERSLD